MSTSKLRLLAGAMLLGLGLSAGSADAAFLIDDFSDEQIPGVYVGRPALSFPPFQAVAPPASLAITGTQLNTPVTRTLNLSTTKPNTAANIGLGAVLFVAGGNLRYFNTGANAGGYTSTAVVEWDFNSTDLTGGSGALQVRITDNDTGFAITLRISDGVSTSVSPTQNIAKEVIGLLSFPLAALLGPADLAAVNYLALTIVANGGLDLEADFVRIVPEPTTLGLLGGALVGLGVAARRRRKAALAA